MPVAFSGNFAHLVVGREVVPHTVASYCTYQGTYLR